MHRFNTLDGMRGLAAIAVMLYHYTHDSAFPIFNNGDLAVDFFFCLSGFVIAYSYKDKLKTNGALWFLKKRLARLYPIYLIGIFISAALIFIANDYSLINSYKSGQLLPIALNTFYIPYFPGFEFFKTTHIINSPIFPYNDPYWSLFFELFVNALFVLVAFAKIKRLDFVLIFAAGILLSLYVIHYKTSVPGWGTTNFFGGFPRVVYPFFIGALILRFVPTSKLRTSNALSTLMVAALGGALLVHHMNPYFWLASALAIVPLFVYLGATVTFRSQRLRWLSNYFGLISYPLYCLHIPVYGIAKHFYGSDHGSLAIASSLIAVFLLSHCLATYLEPSSWLARIRAYKIDAK